MPVLLSKAGVEKIENEMIRLVYNEKVKYVVDRLNSSGSLSQDDAENIRKILEEGRNQKVDEMEMEVSRDVATGLSIDGVKGAEITFGNKGETKYFVKVKYKYDK
ncbi:hypothetical protein K9N68_07600 [Kovacikia minuta CCNUW1]|uniref:hypothetical protein n=1 Tax=Kovacikia minuta TaxID=2931930 RepID=UPI001CCDC097|nr:hypothetical protein [Kovacikia minuta]UBF27769.1 hypothetical protein K9N68_07600 [Kovacikia minuta CCNUW1]